MHALPVMKKTRQFAIWPIINLSHFQTSFAEYFWGKEEWSLLAIFVEKKDRTSKLVQVDGSEQPNPGYNCAQNI